MPRQEKPLKTRLHHVQQHRLAMPGLEAMSLVTEQSFPRHSHDQFGIGIFTQGAQRSWSHLGKIEAAAGNIIMVNPGRCTTVSAEWPTQLADDLSRSRAGCR
jgi:hypothetical protein